MCIKKIIVNILGIKYVEYYITDYVHMPKYIRHVQL